MAVVEVSIIPVGTGTPSMSRYVADVLKVLEESNLKHELTAMGTIIEGGLDEILEWIRKMHEVPFKEGIKRVVTTIEIDDRRDKELTIEGKVRAVESRRE